jgi:ribosomal protein S12 methylthiotransferase
MKTGTIKKDKVNIITLGCSKNLVDSENILTQLRASEIDAHHQLEVKKKADQPNVIIINTCGFIEKAKEESINTILDYAAAKSRGEIDKLYVMGCLSHRYKDELSSEIGEVDDWFGTLDMPLILNRFNVDYKHELLGQRITTTSQHYSYLKISEGCDRACSFCAIPLMRGKHVSRPMEELVQEAKNLAARGTKELILIAQELTYYGIDIYRKRVLSELLEKLADIEGIEWIRLHYAYPTGFPIEIIDTMKAHEKICNYLDIPLQSGSNKVLKAMRRGIKREKTEELIDAIRQKLPEIAIRTTLIAGHPHEEQEDHEETLDFVEKMRFDRLGVFSYSHEEDTHSHSMPDTLTEEEKQERVSEIMEIQQGISLELNQEKIGKIYKTLIDRKEGNYFIGRTEFDSPEVDNEVLVDARKVYLRIGDFANIKIDKVEEFDLFGEVV